MKYLRHKEKGVLVPYNLSILTEEWEVYEEPSAADAPEPVERKKPGPKPKGLSDVADSR